MLLLFTGAGLFAVAEQPLTARAQNAGVEARVTSVSGKAEISGNGRANAVKLLRGTVLNSGDEIDTTGGGRVVIDLTDGSQVVVLPDSRVVIGSFQNASSLKELLQITLGRIRVRINHFQGKPNPYRIKSPTASIAVRGTEFLVSVEALGETRVVVLNGLVEVTSLRDRTHRVVVEPRRGVVVRPDSTINFFTVGALLKEIGERDKTAKSNAARNLKTDDEIGNARSATGVYERTIESIVESGETALPSRFVAFPDAHLDSLDNPAYAGAFTTGEARFNFVPSLNGAAGANGDLRDRYGLRGPRPVDFSIVPEATVFAPLDKFGVVVGGGFGYVRNGLQSLTADANFPLNSSVFPAGTVGLNTVTGATNSNLFSSSLIVAKKFGVREQTSVGFSIERLDSRGHLDETTVQSADGLSLNKQVAARSQISRTRLAVGVKHDFGAARFAAFYRYGTSSGTSVDLFRYRAGVALPNRYTETENNSSELGFRLRGAFSPHLFYGAEGTFLFGRTTENFQRFAVADSTGDDRARRAIVGLGLGYVWRTRAIFSLDATGGLINTNLHRNENATGNLLETERRRARFLSIHTAVQTDVWRNLFVSASLLVNTQSRRTDAAVFPDSFGLFLNPRNALNATGRTTDLYTDFYSNYGVGWRFKPNFVFQYVPTTDYGQTPPRHIFLLRYTFDFKSE